MAAETVTLGGTEYWIKNEEIVSATITLASTDSENVLNSVLLDCPSSILTITTGNANTVPIEVVFTDASDATATISVATDDTIKVLTANLKSITCSAPAWTTGDQTVTFTTDTEFLLAVPT